LNRTSIGEQVSEKAEDARHAVGRELQAEVCWDWSADDVRDLVEEILDEWDGVIDDGEDV
jgi:hypothetical protein